jgi:hypothetical protein
VTSAAACTRAFKTVSPLVGWPLRRGDPHPGRGRHQLHDEFGAGS